MRVRACMRAWGSLTHRGSGGRHDGCRRCHPTRYGIGWNYLARAVLKLKVVDSNVTKVTLSSHALHNELRENEKPRHKLDHHKPRLVQRCLCGMPRILISDQALLWATYPPTPSLKPTPTLTQPLPKPHLGEGWPTRMAHNRARSLQPSLRKMLR